MDLVRNNESRHAMSLRLRWLILARAAVLAVVALTVGLYVLSVPAQFAHHQILCAGKTCPLDQIGPADLASLQHAGISLQFYAAFVTLANAWVLLVYTVVALVLLLRRPDNGMAIFTALMLITAGIAFLSPAEAIQMSFPVLVLPVRILELIGPVSLGIFFLVFPDGRFVPRWSKFLIPIAVLREVLNVFARQLMVVDPMLLELFFMVAVQVYRYLRISNPTQRQQTKWALAGMIGGVGGFGALLIIAALIYRGMPTGLGVLIVPMAAPLFLTLLPLSIGMAVLRSHLWDIDILIRRTLIYGALTAILALVYFGSVVLLQELFRGLTGQDSDIAIVVSTLAIAALFMPLRRRIQQLIDQRFYRSKYNMQQVLAAFGSMARDQVDLNRLNEELIGVVERTMHPESVTLSGCIVRSTTPISSSFSRFRST